MELTDAKLVELNFPHMFLRLKESVRVSIIRYIKSQTFVN